MSSKDPAFLFYGKDFYEGTRMMMPEERACYIDLLIYQHQNDFIPNDVRRLSMYCNGISQATLQATLEAKFKLCNKGWYNEKLSIVINERKEFSSRQSVNGKVGQFWKKAKSLLSAEEFTSVKNLFKDLTNDQILFSVKDFEVKDEATLKAMLTAMLKHLEDEDVNIYTDISLFLKNKKGTKVNRNEEFKTQCLKDEIWKETFYMQKLLKPETIEFALKDFNTHLIQSGEEFKLDLGKYKYHFASWVKKRKEMVKTKTENSGKL